MFEQPKSNLPPRAIFESGTVNGFNTCSVYSLCRLACEEREI